MKLRKAENLRVKRRDTKAEKAIPRYPRHREVSKGTESNTGLTGSFALLSGMLRGVAQGEVRKCFVRRLGVGKEGRTCLTVWFGKLAGGEQKAKDAWKEQLPLGAREWVQLRIMRLTSWWRFQVITW